MKNTLKDLRSTKDKGHYSQLTRTASLARNNRHAGLHMHNSTALHTFHLFTHFSMAPKSSNKEKLLT